MQKKNTVLQILQKKAISYIQGDSFLCYAVCQLKIFQSLQIESLRNARIRNLSHRQTEIFERVC